MFHGQESAPQEDPKSTTRKKVRIKPEFCEGFEHVEIVEISHHQATETDEGEEILSRKVLARLNINNLLQVMILTVAIISLIIMIA